MPTRIRRGWKRARGRQRDLERKTLAKPPVKKYIFTSGLVDDFKGLVIKSRLSLGKFGLPRNKLIDKIWDDIDSEIRKQGLLEPENRVVRNKLVKELRKYIVISKSL